MLQVSSLNKMYWGLALILTERPHVQIIGTTPGCPSKLESSSDNERFMGSLTVCVAVRLVVVHFLSHINVRCPNAEHSPRHW